MTTRHGAASDTRTDSPEIRAYWLDAFNSGLKTTAEIETTIERVCETNCNVLVPQVVRRADFYGDRGHPPRTTDNDVDDDIDPLETLVAHAHDAGIEIHPWMVVGKVWDESLDPPAQPDHVFNTHGPASDDPWVTYGVDGGLTDHNGNYYFEYGHPGAQEYLVETARSIVEGYDVDGLNLDFIRYPGPDPEKNDAPEAPQRFGYNPVALQRYEAATGDSDPDADDDSFIAWRREQVTTLMCRIYEVCFRADPSVRVSVDAVTRWTGPQERDGGWEATANYWQLMQDFRAWLESGIVDTAILMDYKREDDPEQAEMYRQWVEWGLANQYDREVVIGSGLYLNTPADSETQIRVARETDAAGRRASGWAGFSYATPTRPFHEGDQTRAEAYQQLAEVLTETPAGDAETPVFGTDVPVPPMPWKDDPDVGHLGGRVTDTDGDPRDQFPVRVVDNSRTDPVAATTKTAPDGHFFVADLQPGEYGIEAGDAVHSVTVTAGTLTSETFVSDAASPVYR